MIYISDDECDFSVFDYCIGNAVISSVRSNSLILLYRFVIKLCNNYVLPLAVTLLLITLCWHYTFLLVCALLLYVCKLTCMSLDFYHCLFGQI